MSILVEISLLNALLKSLLSFRHTHDVAMTNKDPQIVTRNKVQLTFRFIYQKIKALQFKHQQKRNDGLYAVNVNVGIGFFGQLTGCLKILAHCEEMDLIPFIRLSSPFYLSSKGNNWLEYFFDNIYLNEQHVSDIKNDKITISNSSRFSHLGLERYIHQMDLQSANELFFKYFRIKNEIQNYVETFVGDHFQGFTIGIHYRGTDKSSEAGLLTHDEFIQKLHQCIENYPHVTSVFVSSDEEAVVQRVKKEFCHLNVMSHDDEERSHDGEAIHTRYHIGNNYLKGREALINSLLLARTDVLIRTTSFLSAWSCVFNPQLPVILLTAPYKEYLWFPEREVIRKASQIRNSIV